MQCSASSWSSRSRVYCRSVLVSSVGRRRSQRTGLPVPCGLHDDEPLLLGERGEVADLRVDVGALGEPVEVEDQRDGVSASTSGGVVRRNHRSLSSRNSFCTVTGSRWCWPGRSPLDGTGSPSACSPAGAAVTGAVVVVAAVVVVLALIG